MLIVPTNKLEWYRVIILSAHTSHMANTVASLSGFDTVLNNNKSSSIYFLQEKQLGKIDDTREETNPYKELIVNNAAKIEPLMTQIE